MQKLLLVILLLLSSQSMARGYIISPSVGHVDWQDKIYTVQGLPFRLEANDNTGGISFRYVFDSDFIAGVDLYYINSFEFSAVDSSFNGYGNSYHLLGNAGYIFRINDYLEVIPEFGIGKGEISLHSGTGPNATLDGIDLHYNLTMNFFFNDRMGLRASIRRIDFDLKDDNGAKMDGSLDIYSLSLNIRFGLR